MGSSDSLCQKNSPLLHSNLSHVLDSQDRSTNKSPPTFADQVRCQECSKNSALFAQFLLTSLTYVLLSYFIRLHCANFHAPLPFFLILIIYRT